VIIEPLSGEDGGGFAAIVPDLPGCMSDGETPEAALANVRTLLLHGLKRPKTLGVPCRSPDRA
jgi:predicted RNase H-like HicB family nuclease